MVYSNVPQQLQKVGISSNAHSFYNENGFAAVILDYLKKYNVKHLAVMKQEHKIGKTHHFHVQVALAKKVHTKNVDFLNIAGARPFFIRSPLQYQRSV